MRHFFHKIIVFLSDIEHIVAPLPHKKRVHLFLSYIKIRAKASLNRWFHFREETFLGYRVLVPDYDVFLAIFRQVFIRNTYYFESTSKSPEVIDCGGNIGMSTLYFKYLYPKARITVFEPSREVAQILKENIAINKLLDVNIMEMATGAKEGIVRMYPRGAAACGNTLEQGIAKTVPGGKKSDTETYDVKTIRLSSLINNTIDLLKIDIEGSEGGVMKDLDESEKISRVKEYVMEYHYYPEVPTNSMADIMNRFEKNGFGVQVYDEDVPAYDAQFSLFKNGSYPTGLRARRLDSPVFGKGHK